MIVNINQYDSKAKVVFLKKWSCCIKKITFFFYFFFFLTTLTKGLGVYSKSNTQKVCLLISGLQNYKFKLALKLHIETSLLEIVCNKGIWHLSGEKMRQPK